jgi:hypothetical protein
VVLCNAPRRLFAHEAEPHNAGFSVCPDIGALREWAREALLGGGWNGGWHVYRSTCVLWDGGSEQFFYKAGDTFGAGTGHWPHDSLPYGRSLLFQCTLFWLLTCNAPRGEPQFDLMYDAAEWEDDWALQSIDYSLRQAQHTFKGLCIEIVKECTRNLSMPKRERLRRRHLARMLDRHQLEEQACAVFWLTCCCAHVGPCSVLADLLNVLRCARPHTVPRRPSWA